MRLRGPSTIQAMCNIHSTLLSLLVFSLEGRAWQEPEPSHVKAIANYPQELAQDAVSLHISLLNSDMFVWLLCQI